MSVNDFSENLLPAKKGSQQEGIRNPVTQFKRDHVSG